VWVIKDHTFTECSWLPLTTLILGDELGEIGENAFERCTSFAHIVILPAVRVNKDHAFIWFSGLQLRFSAMGWRTLGQGQLSTACPLHSSTSPPRQGDQEGGIQWLLGVDDRDSQQ
jgi:hypothetical protein